MFSDSHAAARTLLTARRRFLWLLGAAASVAGGAWWWRTAAPALAAGEVAGLSRLVDQLIPRDDYPGAVDLAVDVAIAAAIAESGARLRLAREALPWLERAAGEAADWSRALDAAWAQPAAAPSRRFVHWLRLEAMKRYYADPRAWPGLGYPHPPQPAGYADYRAAPAVVEPDDRSR